MSFFTALATETGIADRISLVLTLRLTVHGRQITSVATRAASSAHAHYGLARVLSDLGRKEDALRSCLRALKLDEGFTLAIRLKEELEAPDPS